MKKSFLCKICEKNVDKFCAKCQTNFCDECLIDFHDFSSKQDHLNDNISSADTTVVNLIESYFADFFE
jgi:hypothetical protein